ncbi:MAG TPA: hypothetical protein VH277_01110 [Gemmatimonadaceae bacterium]|jgi:hypothetical protein|nr:hypothetical protein [Gemmatimonadaceae bacterium]
MRLRAAVYYAMLAVLVGILALQYSKQAVLPRSQTQVLWIAVSASFVSVLILRSGWMRDSGWKRDQARFGTIVNNYYEPRREALSNGFAVGGGVLVALWWAVATWSVVLGGVRRHVAGRGLADFEVAALVGAIVGGLAGAVAGLIVGHFWETRHRRARLHRNAVNA